MSNKVVVNLATGLEDTERVMISAVAEVAGPITDGTVLKRAPDDVGGLLDTSKGWTLHIPGPDEANGAAKLVATQEGKPAAPAVAAAGGTEVASR